MYMYIYIYMYMYSVCVYIYIYIHTLYISARAEMSMMNNPMMRSGRPVQSIL